MNSHFKAAKNAQSTKIANQNEMKFKKNALKPLIHHHQKSV